MSAAVEREDPRKAKKRARRAAEAAAAAAATVAASSVPVAAEGSWGDDGDGSVGAAAPLLSAAAAGEESDAHERTVYVEGISYDAAEVDVEALFATCGSIVDVRMPRYTRLCSHARVALSVAGAG